MSVHRRRFLSRVAAGAAGLLIVPARTAFGYRANERFQLAVLGQMYVADYFYTSIHAYPDVALVAMCNPDQRRLPEIFKTWTEQAKKWSGASKPEERRAGELYAQLLDKKPPMYADFRRMLDEQKSIDGLVVSMFEHYHGPACGTAMRLGKHVFCERPLGLTIGESRALRDLAEKQKVATSIRNPGNAYNPFRRGVELVREGVLGLVEEVHVWFDRNAPDRQQTPRDTQPVPPGLDWDLWLGPTAARPYHPDWMAYATWREFSNGGIGTFGPHASNLAFMALRIHELWQPNKTEKPPTIRVQAKCSGINRMSFPKWETIQWNVPARGDLPPVTFHWYHGPGGGPGAREMLQQKMADRGATPDEQKKFFGYAGAMLVGSKGILVTDDHNVQFTLLPRDKFQVDTTVPKTLPPSRGHYHDWFHACRGGPPAWANFNYANPLSEFLMLGNLATQFEGELEYDPAAAKIINRPEANALLQYRYREGWTL